MFTEHHCVPATFMGAGDMEAKQTKIFAFVELKLPWA